MEDSNKHTIAIAVNRTWRGKLPNGHPYWTKFYTTFVTERLTVDGLADAIRQGYSILPVHKAPRSTENFISAMHIGLDFDDGTRTLDELAADPFIAQHAALIHTTSSHTDEHPRLRVMFMLDRRVDDADKHAELLLATLYRFPNADPACKDVCRLFFGAVDCQTRILGNVLSLETAAAELLAPYRRHIAQLAERAEAERQARGPVERVDKPGDKFQAAVLRGMGDKVRKAPQDGGRGELLKQARLAGGYIATGSLDYGQAADELEAAYMSRPWSTEKDRGQRATAGRKATGIIGAIAGAIEHGRRDPLYFERQTQGHNGDSLGLVSDDDCRTIVLEAGQYIGGKLEDLPRRVSLQAPTGSGKTTAAIELKGRVILVLPTQAKIEQLAIEHEDAATFYQHGQTVDADSKLIFTTPESFSRLLSHIADPSQWTLVVDESHLISQAGYRPKGFNNVIRTFDGDWRQVILMTGTPLPLVTPGLQSFETVQVKQPKRSQPATRVVWQTHETAVNKHGETVDRKHGDLAATVGTMLALHANKRHLLYVNDKGQTADTIHHEAIAAGYDADSIYHVNADLRDGPGYRSIVSRELVPADCRILITTSVIETGINLQDDPDEWMIHFVTPVSSVEAQQLVSRFRKDAAPVFWYNAGQGDGTSGNYLKTAENIYSNARAIAAQLNELPTVTDDILATEHRRQTLHNAARFGSTVLVDYDTDEDGAGRWVASPVGVNNRAYDILKVTEVKHPDSFKAHTGAYGWEWAEDIIAVVKPGRGHLAARIAYTAEQEEQRQVYIGTIADELRTQKPDEAREQLRSRARKLDNDWRRIAKIALAVYETNGAEWQRAINGAELTQGKTRRVNDLRRRIQIQAERDTNPLTRWVYATFNKGDRLTPAEIAGLVSARFANDPDLAPFAARGEITERRAVLMLGDYFTMKRCKLATEDGQRTNGYELITDAGAVAGVDVREFMKPAETVSLNFSEGLKDNSETRAQRQPAELPSAPDPAYAAIYLPEMNTGHTRRSIAWG